MTHKFEELQPGTIAWLGDTPHTPKAHVVFEELRLDGGRPFWVRNGHWNGVLYPNMKMLVVHTKAFYDVYILEIEQPKAIIKENFDDDIPL